MAKVFNLQKARAGGMTDEQIQAFLSKRPELSVAGAQAPTPAPAEGGGIRDWLPTIGSIAGGVIGAPLGGVGAIGGSALGGGAGEALRQLLAGQGADISNIGKEAALGGAGGVVGKVAGTAFKGARALVGSGAKAGGEVAEGAVKQPGVLERIGQSMQKGVAKPKVRPSATAFGEEAELMAQKKAMGIQGAAEEQRAQSNIVYNKLKGDLQNKLATNNPGIDVNLSKQSVQQAIKGTINYDAKSPAWKRALDVRTKQVLEQKNMQQMVKYKLELGDKLGNAFTKIERGSPLTVQEEAGIATWSALDRIITTTDPTLKEITLQMSALHKLAPGLKSSAEKGVQMGMLGKIPGATPVIQGLQDMVGRGAEALGKSNIPGMAANVTGQTTSQLGTRAILNPPKAEGATSGFESDSPTGKTALADFGEDQTGSAKQQQIKQAFLQAMLANPKQAAQLKQIYEFGFGGTGAGPNVGKTTAKDYGLAKSGLKNAEEVRRLYKEDPNALTKQLVPGKFFSRKFDSALYDAADTLLRLRTGAQANPSEIRGYMKTIGPSFGDSAEVVEYKLAKLESDLRFYLQGGTASGLEDFTSGGSQSLSF